MFSILRKSLLVTLALSLLLCGAYPVAVTLVARAAFPAKANGSLIQHSDKIVGSSLIGQRFSRPQYFHSRPSAAGEGYDGANSSGSNLGPTNGKLVERIKNDVETLLRDNPTVKHGEIPVDLVTASGSGLDPDLSPEAAFAQVERVSTTRQADPAALHHLVNSLIKGPDLGFLGQARVNVLALNLKLDETYPMTVR